ncbi:DUF4190 domain-containing protein [Kocuria massiliensis]|uniref:DUF4190 domain-containing protein n=1 Tax=Kocuria massiliensis TaxID=1926282 RepID=UPI000A1CA22E|nr:DUF4190 domain-containing protein [Kocuria massiliensis]
MENPHQSPQQPYNPQQHYSPAQPQQSYAPQPVNYLQAPAEPKGMSVASMVIGLVNIFMGWTVILPIIGLILGLVGLRKEPAGRGMAITGVILSGLIVLGWVVIFLFLFGIIGGAAVSGTQT